MAAHTAHIQSHYKSLPLQPHVPESHSRWTEAQSSDSSSKNKKQATAAKEPMSMIKKIVIGFIFKCSFLICFQNGVL